MDNNDFLRDKRKRAPQTEEGDRGERKTFGERRDGDRKPFVEHREGDRKPYGERRDFNRADRKPFGERRESEQRGFGERRDFNRDDHKPYGERKPFSGNNERRTYGGDGDRKPYGEDREGYKPRYSSDRPAYGDRKPYGERRDGGQRSFGERQPYNSDRPTGERRSFNPNFTADNKLREGGERDFNRDDRKPYGDRKPFGERRDFNKDFNRDDRKPYGERRDGEHKPYSERRYSSDRKPFGDRKPFEKREGDSRPYGERRDFNRDDRKPFGERRDGGSRPYGERKSFDKPFGKRGDGAGKFGKKTSFKSDKTRVHGEFSDGSYPTFAPAQPTGEVRLNRHIAASGHCSRRDADLLIRDGHVMVNDVVVTEMGHKIVPTDRVQLDGVEVSNEKKVYILMNKPKGFVTTLEDPHADKTVIDLLGSVVKERVYPVGRLDKNSLGVLLLTNDGDLTSRLTHPSYNKKKVYQATLDTPLTHADMQKIADGVELEDGSIAADAIDYAAESKKEVGIEIHSGRNRVVRRIFESLGYKVTRLDRVYFAGLTKRNLKRGQWRFLTATEVEKLVSGLYE